MTEPDDPSRLLDTSSVPGSVRDALRAAQADVGSDAQVARLAQRLGPLLGPVAPAAPGAAAGKVLATKLGLAGVALLIAGGGAWLLFASSSAPSPPAPIPAPASESSPAAPALATPATPVAVPEIAPSVAAPAPAVAVAPTKLRQKPTPPTPPSEAELLEQARAALKSDPARALQWANEHAARFPRGVLVQEREVLAIQALRQLGRTAEADRRAQAFAKAFPGSAFQRKLR
jgi:hypothetical protein